MVKSLLNISDIIVKAMNALHGMDRYWEEAVGEYTLKNDIKVQYLYNIGKFQP